MKIKCSLTARRSRVEFVLLITLCLLLVAPVPLRAQQSQAPAQDDERTHALKLLWQESRAEDALPLLEKLAEANPNDGIVMFSLGFALFGHTKILKDASERQQTRIRARGALLRAKELGVTEPLLDSLLSSLPADGGKDDVFSENKEADGAMRDGEAAYVRGDFAAAAAAYQRALQADPKLYAAALFAGDMYYKLKQPDRAGEWFARAIALNPDAETAYRYWGDALLLAGQQTEARDKFIDAIVAEPGNDLAYSGLTQWGKNNGIALAHPQIDVPTNVTPMQDNKLTINIDPKMLDSKNKNDPAAAWMMYGLTRAAWATQKFAKEYPQEQTYRHTLREETEALHAVAQSAHELLKGRTPSDPSLANLLKLDDAGLLEPYIFFNRADKGIMQDYAAYRRANHDKLHRYWVEFVVHEAK